MPLMAATEPRTQAAFDAATRRVGAAVGAVAGQVATALGQLATTSLRVADRDLLNLSQFELRRHAQLFHGPFLDALRAEVRNELAPRGDRDRPLAEADWRTLSLVDDAEMEGRMFADRLGQSISHACDTELRELAGYMGSLLSTERGDIDRHPLRAEVLGTLVYRSIEAVSQEVEPRKILAREFGRALEKAMPGCYADVVRDLQALGVRPAALTSRGVEGPGVGGNSGYATLGDAASQSGELDTGASGTRLDGPSTLGGSHRNTRAGDSRSGSSTRPGGAPGPHGRGGARDVTADAALMALLRRLTAAPGAVADFADVSTGFAGRGGPESLRTPMHADADGRFSTRGGLPAWISPAAAGSPVSGLMAVNLIRAHRDELVQASTGQLDHLVIDVVGSLFDHILSDARVSPQMARQIARLQLPVLRVALKDPGFFSSRRHPVRRFVNRMASLACAFDDFDAGPGLQFITRVRELVQEIVEGDFDQIDLYTAKVAELERFIAEQTGLQAAQSGAAVALDRKEAELRLQQRCRLHLQSALQPVAMPPWLRDFVEQVWSQALVIAAVNPGADTDRILRYRRAGRDLILSVQPKGSPAMRKKFLMQLPPLMKDLKDGMALVGWPEAATQQFFATLMPAHAESMKMAPLSELEHNLLAKQLEAIFAQAPADEHGERAGDSPIEADGAVVEQRFSAEEARAVGLVAESAVDWSGPVDIDLGVEPAAEPEAQTTGSAEIDIVLDLQPAGRAAEATEPTAGPDLMDHIKLGFAYQMHLKDEWQKVRLTHVSAGRTFFVFSRGRNHQETLSMTARMLARMCETGRLRAVESAYLMERATQRARRQLAALRPSARTPAH